MINKKLLEILVRLTAEQRKRLRLFLLSPFFSNTGRSALIVELFDYIMRLEADENHPDLQKSTVSFRFFPEHPFQENQKNPLDSLTSELFNLTKSFLGIIKKEKNKASEGLALLEFYRTFGMEDRFWQTAQLLKKEMDKDMIRDEDYYQKKFELDIEITSFSTGSNSFQDDANLLSNNYYLDMAYAFNKLQILAALKYQKILASFEDNSISPLFNLISNLTLEQNPLSAPIHTIYHLVLNLIDDPQNETLLQEFSGLLEKHRSIIPDKIYKEQLMPYYRNFMSIAAVRSTEKEPKQRVYQVYKEHYGQGLFFHEKMIPVTALSALFQMAIRQNDTEWALQLLSNHPPAQISGTRYTQEAYNLLWADYYFAQKQFDAALEKIEMRLFENANYSILADIIMIKIYFDQKNDMLDYRMKALDQKIRRSGLSVQMKERYHNFLKKLDKINKYLLIKQKDKLSKLLEEIKTTQNIYERDWLLAKATDT